MSNYQFNVKDTRVGDNTWIDMISGIDDEKDPLCEILHRYLRLKRESRFRKLFINYTGDYLDINDIRSYLPLQYKQYAYDLNILRDQMSSLYEISKIYEITDIKRLSDCYGCANDRGGQNDHMECPTGCLHDPSMCEGCS